LITGASRGFGRELTEQLLARGDRVAATLRRPDQLADLVAIHGDRLWVRALDVTDTAQLREVVDAAFTELDRIEAVVSNAGYGVIGAAEELSDARVGALTGRGRRAAEAAAARLRRIPPRARGACGPPGGLRGAERGGALHRRRRLLM
jgi:NAD(P)-dependent dehydrogenase (short-subunit alcohol dehydrogenase family)